MNKKRLFIYLAAGAMLAGITVLSALNLSTGLTPAWKPINLPDMMGTSDHQTGYVINIMDAGGSVVSKAARGVAVGDEIIRSDGNHYRVTRVGGNYAEAEYMGKDRQLLAYTDYFSSMAVPAAALARDGNNTVGIYHTHSDESYVPTDGKEAIPFKGGIYRVGQSLANKLSNENVRVSYDKSPHDPHDNNAYYRSRRTASRLMKDNPVAILDVHRDGIPDASYYRKTISNENVAQLRLVVGRQNPNMKANLDFAKKMMAYANKTHPGIVKEIFMAKGNYNQDLMPTALLIEAGTHVNSRAEAENGVALFADAIPTVLGITGGPGGGFAGAPRAGGVWTALAWIIGLTVLGGGAFLVISSGGLKQAKSRLQSYIGREFTGFLGPVKRLPFGKMPGRGKAENTPDTGTVYRPDANEIDSENRKKIR